MDSDNRELERKALSGDIEAAIELYFRSHRREPRQRQNNWPSQSVEFLRRNFNGDLDFNVLSATEILIRPVYEVHTAPSRDTTVVPVDVNRIPYSIHCRFYYDEELGWTPFIDEEVKNAKERSKLGLISSRQPASHFLYPSRSTLKMARLDRPSGANEPTTSAVRVAFDTLMEAVPAWVQQNPEMVRQAALMDTNNDIIATSNALEKIRIEYEMLQNRLGILTINELRLK